MEYIYNLFIYFILIMIYLLIKKKLSFMFINEWIIINLYFNFFCFSESISYKKYKILI